MALTLYRKIDKNWQRPALSIYISFFVLSFITINTYYLVFFEIQYRYYLWVALAGGYLVSIYLHQRYKPYLEIFINVFALIFFAFFFREIFKNITNFGSMLGQLLAILLVMRSYILFSKDDFLVPLVVSITLMLLCSIPSYESNYVISLQIFLVLVVISLYLLAKHREIDETRTGIFAIERNRKSYSSRNETKIIAFFSLTALISSTLIYLVIPHQADHQTRYMREFSMIFGAKIPTDEMDQAPAKPHETGGRPVDTVVYAGFNEEQFNITTGQTIREGPKANEVVMEVQVNYPSYMKAMVWDEYDGKGWERSGALQVDSKLGSKKELRGRMYTQRYELSNPKEISLKVLESNQAKYKGTVHLIRQQIASSFIFVPWQATSITIPLAELWEDDDGEIKLNPTGASTKKYLTGVESYEFTSATYFPSGMESTYQRERSKGEFLERYTKLPEDVDKPINGRKLSDLAEKIARDAKAMTDYEKTVAVLNYLKSTGKYSLKAPYCPPEYDTVAYFLLETSPKRGHCEIFSSSMAVLLRLLDVPCRIATGYSPGDYMFTKDRYIIREKDAHAWVEVFFPELGWVSFDPTPSSVWSAFKGRLDEVIATASNVVNELYVYDPQQFYKARIEPVSSRTAGLAGIWSSRMEERMPDWLKMNILPIFLVFFLLLGLVIAVYRFRLATESVTITGRRVSRSNYRELIRLARNRGMKIYRGDTPYEVLMKIGDVYPDSFDSAENFFQDFWIFNFAPEYMKKDVVGRLKSDYRTMMKSLRKSRNGKNARFDRAIK